MGSGSAAAAVAPAAAEDAYDDRHRQAKALAQYERQKAAWDRMQAHLLSATASPPSHSKLSSCNNAHSHQSHSNGSAQNMATATATARAKREDYTIVEVATAAEHNGNGSHAWEGLLRCNNEQEARRLVPIGRTCVPYPLYSEIHDPNTLPDDHLFFARVVSEDDVAGPQGGTQGNSLPSSASAAQPGSTWSASTKYQRGRTAAQEHVRASLANESVDMRRGTTKSKSAVQDLFMDDVSTLRSAAPLHEDAENDLSSTPYYEAQLRRFAPYVQQRLGHLLQPRTFLHVEGHPAPYTTAADASHEPPRSPSPVEYFPPPSPPQMQMWASTSSTPSSRLPSCSGYGSGGPPPSARSVAASRTRAGQRAGRASPADSDEDAAAAAAVEKEEAGSGGAAGVAEESRRLPRGSVATEAPPDTDRSDLATEWRSTAPHSPPPSPLHPMRVRSINTTTVTAAATTTTAAADHAGKPKIVPCDGPAMELSTRSLFFQTRPRELTHGSATLHNTGTTTIYYSWIVVDAMQEHLREVLEAEQAAGDDDNDDHEDDHEDNHDFEDGDKEGGESSPAAKSGTQENGDNNNEHRKSYGQRAKQEHHSGPSSLSSAAAGALPYTLLSLTHQLAAHQRAAQDSFFFMSAPMNGVVLPGQSTVFPFSVRATREGVFQSTYELLTVPPAPQRIFVRLRALVQRAGPSLTWLARPVAEALEAKVAVDAQRRLVQQLATNTRAIEATQLQDCVTALDKTAEVARQAAREKRAAQEAAWHRANRLTFDHVPFHAAVHDKLAKLSAVVRETYILLNQREGEVRGERTPNSSPQATSPATMEAPFSASSDRAEIQWDGALLPLLYQIMRIRDNSTRQTFFDAMQVLLRAARAARDVVEDKDPRRTSNFSRGNTHRADIHATEAERDDEQGVESTAESAEAAADSDDEVPLTVLFCRAASALADVVVSRQRTLAERQYKDLLLQPIKPSAALVLAPTMPSEGGSAAAGTGKSRSNSPSGANAGKSSKKSVAAPGSARGGAAASVAESKESKAGVGGSDRSNTEAMTPAQRVLLHAVPSAALNGFSVAQANQATMTLLRAAEERVTQARMDSELEAAKQAFIALHTALFREVVDAACDRTPLVTCTPERLAELRDVQRSALLVVDTSVDPLVVPPVGKPGKRK